MTTEITETSTKPSRRYVDALKAAARQSRGSPAFMDMQALGAQFRELGGLPSCHEDYGDCSLINPLRDFELAKIVLDAAAQIAAMQPRSDRQRRDLEQADKTLGEALEQLDRAVEAVQTARASLASASKPFEERERIGRLVETVFARATGPALTALQELLPDHESILADVPNAAAQILHCAQRGREIPKATRHFVLRQFRPRNLTAHDAFIDPVDGSEIR